MTDDRLTDRFFNVGSRDPGWMTVSEKWMTVEVFVPIIEQSDRDTHHSTSIRQVRARFRWRDSIPTICNSFNYFLTMTFLLRRCLNKVSASQVALRHCSNKSNIRSHLRTCAIASTASLQPFSTCASSSSSSQEGHGPLSATAGCLMAAALFTMDSQRRESKIADCCGIAGVVGTINHDSR